jgi:hypothetical protein
MSGSSGRGHQPSMHGRKDKTDMDPTVDWKTRNKKPPEDKMTAKDALPAPKEKGKVERTKSTDKKSVSCSLNLHHHLVMLTFEALLCDILGRNAVSGLMVYNEVTEKLSSMAPFETRHKVSGMCNMLSITKLVMAIEIST